MESSNTKENVKSFADLPQASPPSTERSRRRTREKIQKYLAALALTAGLLGFMIEKGWADNPLGTQVEHKQLSDDNKVGNGS